VTQPQLDPTIHAPKRLAATAILAASEWAEFAYLRERLEVSDSVLSKHMKLLQEAGYVKVSKRGRGRGASTWYRLTREGRSAFEAHVAYLQSLIADVPSVVPAPAPAVAPSVAGDGAA
jgi:DNA-binding transcriptional ArsR family regulator